MKAGPVIVNLLYVAGWVWAVETHHKLAYFGVTTVGALLIWGRQLYHFVSEGSISYAAWCTAKSQQLLARAGVVCGECGRPLKDCRCGEEEGEV